MKIKLLSITLLTIGLLSCGGTKDSASEETVVEEKADMSLVSYVHGVMFSRQLKNQRLPFINPEDLIKDFSGFKENGIGEFNANDAIAQLREMAQRTENFATIEGADLENAKSIFSKLYFDDIKQSPIAKDIVFEKFEDGMLDFWNENGFLVINNFSIEIINAFQNQDRNTSLWKGGVKYAAYNIGLAPAIFFCTKHLKSKNEAIFSGILAGVIGILPAFFMYISMLSFNSDILQSTFPVNIVLDALGYDYLKVFFQIILFGTFIETGASLIHGLNQRVFDSFSNVSNNHRITFSLIALVISIFLSEKIGLIKLISNGYGMITWGYWLVFVIPVLIIGSIKIFKK